MFSNPISETLLGQYDIVHVRLSMLVIQNDDLGPTLENLVRFLSMSLAHRCLHCTEKLRINAAAGKFVRNYTERDELTWLLTTSLEPGGYPMCVECNPLNIRIDSVSLELRSDAWYFV